MSWEIPGTNQVMSCTWRPIALFLLSAAALAAAAPPAPHWLSAGESLYREGRLPTGEALPGSLKGDRTVQGMAMTCASCHMASGLGSSEGGSNEGGVRIPPIHGSALFQPRYGALPRLKGAERERLGLQAPPLRPAYTDASLARALRSGLDPAGREFNEVMPRYALTDSHMALLIRYLKALSATPPPGVDGKTIRFATVIGSEVNAADREAMLKPLQSFLAFNNDMPRTFGHRMFRSPAGRNLIQDHRTYTLEPWILSGPPSTWRRQLEARYRKAPVFALLGGISYGSWRPIHDFCEARRIPCILPITDLPVVSDKSWYTLYFSRGLRQEGEAAARFLASGPAAATGSRVVQVVQGAAGRALAEGFRAAWQELGRPGARTLELADGERVDPARLRDLVSGEPPAALLLWAESGVLEALGPGLVPAADSLPLLVSGGAWKERLYGLPEALRGRAYITFPYRHPDDEARALRNTVPSLALEAGRRDSPRIASRMYSLVQILSKAFLAMDGAYYRDNLFDRIGLLPDQSLPDFERLGFGPGQRYASKGCYVMQLSAGPEPRLLKRSDWVIH